MIQTLYFRLSCLDLPVWYTVGKLKRSSRAVQWHYIDKRSNDTVPNHTFSTINSVHIVCLLIDFHMPHVYFDEKIQIKKMLCRAWPQNINTVINFRRGNLDKSNHSTMLAIRTSGVIGHNRIMIVALRPDILCIIGLYRLQHRLSEMFTIVLTVSYHWFTNCSRIYIQRKFATST